MADPTDKLVQDASRGDDKALDALLARFLPDLETFIRLRVGARISVKESSSDLAQSVCREVLQDLGQIEYRGERAFKQWVFLAAIRKIKDRDKFWRRDRRDVGRETNDVGTSAVLDNATPSYEVMKAEDVASLEKAFERLPDDYRTVITLSRYLGMTHIEIADEMGRSEGAVAVLLHRALARLSVILGAK